MINKGKKKELLKHYFWLCSITSPKKNWLHYSNYIADMVMRSKFDNSSISMKEVVVTSIFFYFLFFFFFLRGGRWSWLKFNNLGLALSIALKFYKMVAKELTLKVRKFLGLLPTFVDVIGEKLVGSFLAPFPSWIGLMTFLLAAEWSYTLFLKAFPT